MGLLREVDLDRLLEGSRGLGERDLTPVEELGISSRLLDKRLEEIREKQGILLRYRELQALQLTSLQARILEAITPEVIAEAPLRDLVAAFKILKDKELVMEGRPSEIKGLVGYLLELEKEEQAIECSQFSVEEMEQAVRVAGQVTAGPEDKEEEKRRIMEDPDYLPSFK